jgi:hypothetical protein
MYDKFGIALRIETTANDVSFFKHHRNMEHRDGLPTRGLAPVKKSIYSLIDLREIMLGCNRRYLAHLSALDDFSAGVRALERVTKPRVIGDTTVKGIDFFEAGTVPCCIRCKTRGSISQAFDGASCLRTSPCSRRIDCHGSCAGCWTSA